MRSTTGRPRIVTDDQVASILEWYCNHKSAAQVARDLGIREESVARIVRTYARDKVPERAIRERVNGVLEPVSDDKIAAVVKWWLSHVSAREMARKLGLTFSAFQYAIAIRGLYKQPSPEALEATKSQRRSKFRALRAAGYL